MTSLTHGAQRARFRIAMLSVSLLAACGGGGDGATTSTSPVPVAGPPPAASAPVAGPPPAASAPLVDPLTRTWGQLRLLPAGNPVGLLTLDAKGEFSGITLGTPSGGVTRWVFESEGPARASHTLPGFAAGQTTAAASNGTVTLAAAVEPVPGVAGRYALKVATAGPGHDGAMNTLVDNAGFGGAPVVHVDADGGQSVFWGAPLTLYQRRPAGAWTEVKTMPFGPYAAITQLTRGKDGSASLIVRKYGGAGFALPVEMWSVSIDRHGDVGEAVRLDDPAAGMVATQQIGARTTSFGTHALWAVPQGGGVDCLSSRTRRNGTWAAAVCVNESVRAQGVRSFGIAEQPDGRLIVWWTDSQGVLRVAYQQADGGYAPPLQMAASVTSAWVAACADGAGGVAWVTAAGGIDAALLDASGQVSSRATLREPSSERPSPLVAGVDAACRLVALWAEPSLTNAGSLNITTRTWSRDSLVPQDPVLQGTAPSQSLTHLSLAFAPSGAGVLWWHEAGGGQGGYRRFE